MVYNNINGYVRLKKIEGAKLAKFID